MRRRTVCRCSNAFEAGPFPYLGRVRTARPPPPSLARSTHARTHRHQRRRLRRRLTPPRIAAPVPPPVLERLHTHTRLSRTVVVAAAVQSAFPVHAVRRAHTHTSYSPPRARARVRRSRVRASAELCFFSSTQLYCSLRRVVFRTGHRRRPKVAIPRRIRLFAVPFVHPSALSSLSSCPRPAESATAVRTASRRRLLSARLRRSRETPPPRRTPRRHNVRVAGASGCHLANPIAEKPSTGPVIACPPVRGRKQPPRTVRRGLSCAATAVPPVGQRREESPTHSVAHPPSILLSHSFAFVRHRFPETV